MPDDPKTSRFRYAATIERWITMTLLAALIIGVYFVLAPFLPAILWAIVLCCTTWPLHEGLVQANKGRRSAAALILTCAIAVVLIAPFAVVGMTLADNADELGNIWRRLLEDGLQQPPAWLGEIPIVGPTLKNYWIGLVAGGAAGVIEELRKYTQPIRTAALASGAAFAQGVLQLTLSIVIAFFVFRDGDTASMRLSSTVARIAGDRGTDLLRVATATTRGVVYGILGTALAQGVLAAFGLWIAGVPASPLLGLLTFFLSPVPIGPPLVWLPAALWLFYHDHAGWGIFILIWGTAVVSSVDNVIKPLIISRGSNLPFILVLLGILGGVVAFGFIGVFLGPVLLAIAYSLLSEWSAVGARRA